MMTQLVALLRYADLSHNSFNGYTQINHNIYSKKGVLVLVKSISLIYGHYFLHSENCSYLFQTTSYLMSHGISVVNLDFSPHFTAGEIM